MEPELMLPLLVEDFTPVEAVLLPLAARLDFLPRHFGPAWVEVRNTIEHTMARLCPHDSGGHWDYYDLSNGGALLVPSGAARYRIDCEDGVIALSALATGIVVCGRAYNLLSFGRDGSRHADMFYRLNDFLFLQPEAGDLLALLA